MLLGLSHVKELLRGSFLNFLSEFSIASERPTVEGERLALLLLPD